MKIAVVLFCLHGVPCLWSANFKKYIFFFYLWHCRGQKELHSSAEATLPKTAHKDNFSARKERKKTCYPVITFADYYCNDKTEGQVIQNHSSAQSAQEHEFNTGINTTHHSLSIQFKLLYAHDWKESLHGITSFSVAWLHATNIQTIVEPLHFFFPQLIVWAFCQRN